MPTWNQYCHLLTPIVAKNFIPMYAVENAAREVAIYCPAVDGVWTHTFPICAFVQENTVNNVQLVNYPNVCPEERIRKHGELYCEKHLIIAQGALLPTNRKTITVDNLRAAQLHLQGLDSLFSSLTHSVHLPSDSSVTKTATDTVDLMNPASYVNASPCSKNLGDGKVYPARSRGYLFVVKAGGHIEMFAPIFKSESPSQVFLILIGYLYNVLQTIPEADWQNFFLAYDNMCNLDKMRATKQPLPLPAPYDRMWAKISKIIDRFHLGNHKNHKCHVEYNPNKLEMLHPDRKSTNTQVCEQTFSWLRGFKTAMFKMPKYHQLFFLHRVVTRRNRYLQKCSAD